MTSEEEMYRKVTGKDVVFKGKPLAFTDEENLIHDVKSLYPATSHITIFNIDRRDSEDKPFMVHRKVGNIHLSHSGSLMSRTVHTSGCWKEAFAIVEKGRVFLSIHNCSVDDTW